MHCPAQRYGEVLEVPAYALSFVVNIERCFGMVRNSSPVMGTLRSRLDALEQALPALKKGERLDCFLFKAMSACVA